MTTVERLVWLFAIGYVFVFILGTWLGHVMTLATVHHLLREQKGAKIDVGSK